MPDATITSTASTFGTITGTFAADQSTVTGTITGTVTGTLTGSVGVPGPQGAAGQGVPVGGTAGQFLTKIDGTNYNTDWTTVNLSQYLQKSGGVITGDIQSNNGSGYRSYDGLFNQVNVSATIIQLLKSGGGGGALSVEWDGITFSDGKQTSKFPGTATLFANAALTGNPSAPTPATSDNSTSIATTAFVKAQGYLTSAPVTSVAGKTGVVTLDYTDISGLGSMAVINDAPSNGSQYARKNAAWDVVIPGDRYLTSSTTSNTIGNGNKTFTIGTGLSYTPTQNITISFDASNHMHGEVLTYNSGTGVLTVEINHHTGSGTYTAWVVNVGGVTPATSVAWGAITGTLSTQTDLQNALNLKLDVTTAASTYYLQTNPSGFIDASALTGYATETFVTTQGYITQATADGLYYPLTGNPSGFLTSVPPPTLTNLTSDISWDGSANTGRLLIAGVYDIGGGFTEARLNFTSGVPTQPATGDFWTNGTDFFYRESGSTKTIASQSYVSANYQPLSGMSSYLTTASAAATYFTIASAASKADLASPTFTGTPTLPTGTIATTQSPGNNTTAVATTAFVRTDNNVKAWVNFNGTGTVAIRSSFNVTSITDHGVGTYTVNLTNAISSNATGVGMVSDDGTAYRGINLQGGIANITTTSYKINTFATSTQQDPTVVQLAIIR